MRGFITEAGGGFSTCEKAPDKPLLATAIAKLVSWFFRGAGLVDGGGGGNRTRVPRQPTSRDYMLSLKKFFCDAMAFRLDSHCLVRMRLSRPTARGLRGQPCLLWRSSSVAGVHR